MANMSQQVTHPLPPPNFTLKPGVNLTLLPCSIEAVSVIALPGVWPILQGLEPLHIVLWRKGALPNSSCSDDADEVQQLVLAAYQGASRC